MEEYRPGGVFLSGGLTQWSTGRTNLANFPSPFLDYASTQIPKDVQGLWRWCAFFSITNPLINAALSRKASYPVTDLVVQHSSEDVAAAWKTLLESDMDVNQLRLVFNMDLYTYGRAAFSVFPPFRKYMICTSCKRKYLAEAIKYTINPRTKRFQVDCPTCGKTDADVVDLVLASNSGFALRRWAPQELICEEIGFLNRKYFYIQPATWFRNRVKRCVRSEINSTPQEIVDAILRDQAIRIRDDRIFVKTEDGAIPNVDTRRSAWPFGSLSSVLKDAYHLQIAFKNEEVNLVTQMIPFRAVSPETSSDPAANVFQTGTYSEWESLVRQEYGKFLADPGYLSVLPVPMKNVQTQTAPSPMLPKDPMYQRLSAVLAGIRVPQSIVVEGAPWSGAVPNLKLFETDCKKNQNVQKDMLDFIVKETRRVLQWPVPETSLGTMMSVDAIQRISAYSSLVSAGNMDQQTLHEDVLGLDHVTIKRRLEAEHKERLRQQIDDDRAFAEERARQERDAMEAQAAMGQDPGAVAGAAPVAGAPVADGAVPPEQEQLPPAAQSGLPTVQDIRQTYPAESGMPVPRASSPGLGGSHFTANDIIASIPPGAGPETATGIIQILKNQSALERSRLLVGIARAHPTLHQMVMQGLGGASEQPLPEQLPPRREAG